MPLNIDWQQILLHLLNFVILFAILYFLLYKPVKNFMQKRDEHYKEIDEKAKKDAADAEALKADYEARLSAADEEIRQKNEAAKRATDEKTAERLSRAQADAEKILTSAREQAEADKQKIIGEAQGEIAGLVAEATEKLVLKDSSEAYDRFLDEAERGGKDEK